jgi:type VI secretion system protein VasD
LPHFALRLMPSLWRCSVAALLGLALSACASRPPPPKPEPPPPPPKPTIVWASLETQKDVNPDSRGRSSPVVIKFFELKSLAAFNSADFFSIFERDRETLGAELIAREEFQLMPEQKQRFERQLQPETNYIGVVAAFRELERAQWRAAVPVPPNQTTALIVRLQDNHVSISSPEH